jgi:hypothetical protein
MSNTNTTYGEAIEKMKEQSDRLYDMTGALRDHAHLSEKQHWNNLRNLYRNAWHELYKLSELAQSNGIYDQKL